MQCKNQKMQPQNKRKPVHGRTGFDTCYVYGNVFPRTTSSLQNVKKNCSYVSRILVKSNEKRQNSGNTLHLSSFSSTPNSPGSSSSFPAAISVISVSGTVSALTVTISVQLINKLTSTMALLYEGRPQISFINIVWVNTYLSPPRSRDRFLARFSRSRSLSRRRRAGEGERPIVYLNFISRCQIDFLCKNFVLSMRWNFCWNQLEVSSWTDTCFQRFFVTYMFLFVPLIFVFSGINANRSPPLLF